MMAQGTSTFPRQDLPELLFSLYEQELQRRPTDRYLRTHSGKDVVTTQAAVFDFYARYLPARGKVLDWGCRHAPDSCLMRARFGPELQIDGSDFAEPGTYAAFHDYAELEYQQLTSVTRLPYDDNSFDAVVASGALEHTAMDYESLKELYRILKVDGRLIVTYLPNRLSIEEWYKRKVLRAKFHRRLYGLDEITRLLKRTGFYPLVSGYQTHLDLLAGTAVRHRLLRVLRWALPLHWFSSTLCLVAEKVRAM
jgi:ubiquinone/menaquinone biosynthesis C-methylase UbiE